MDVRDIDQDAPVYGATAIGRVMGLTPRQAFHALEHGLLDANKFGGRWISTPRRLRRVAGGEAKAENQQGSAA